MGYLGSLSQEPLGRIFSKCAFLNLLSPLGLPLPSNTLGSSKKLKNFPRGCVCVDNIDLLLIRYHLQKPSSRNGYFLLHIDYVVLVTLSAAAVGVVGFRWESSGACAPLVVEDFIQFGNPIRQFVIGKKGYQANLYYFIPLQSGFSSDASSI